MRGAARARHGVARDPFAAGARALSRAAARHATSSACSTRTSALYLDASVLAKVDRASMAASLEVRAPFLDTAVAEFAGALPLDWKLRRTTGKWILKRRRRRLLPARSSRARRRASACPIGALAARRARAAGARRAPRRRLARRRRRARQKPKSRACSTSTPRRRRSSPALVGAPGARAMAAEEPRERLRAQQIVVGRALDDELAALGAPASRGASSPAATTSTSPALRRAPSTTSEPRTTYMISVPRCLCAMMRPCGVMRASCSRRPFSSYRSSTLSPAPTSRHLRSSAPNFS